MMIEDILYQIFTKHLSSVDENNCNAKDLISLVTAKYVHSLTEVGHIPLHMIHTVVEDVEEEVTLMYRKKTYGHYNLKEYKKNSAKK